MKLYTYSTTCDICGGEGVTTPNGAADQLLRGCAHRDPSVCRDILAQRAEDLKRKEEKAAQEAL